MCLSELDCLHIEVVILLVTDWVQVMLHRNTGNGSIAWYGIIIFNG